MQEIADALEGTDKIILVKNPKSDLFYGLCELNGAKQISIN